MRRRRTPTRTPARIGAGRTGLDAELAIPDSATGLVLFTQRTDPRYRSVAARLLEAGYATMLADLLTSVERELDPHGTRLAVDVGLLARRLVGVVDWLGVQAITRRLPLCLFGSGAAGAAVLVAAARRTDAVTAVVSCDGRPELAGGELIRIRTPVLLLVGELDAELVEAGSRALPVLGPAGWLHAVPGAARLFAGPAGAGSGVPAPGSTIPAAGSTIPAAGSTVPAAGQDRAIEVADAVIEWLDQQLGGGDGHWLDDYLSADGA